jgi:hypothetical protein
LQREILEIMLARATDADEFLAHDCEFSLKTKRSHYAKTQKKQSRSCRG